MTDAPPRLASHQQRAVERLLRDLTTRGGALLADDVGLGKSFVASAIARSMQDEGYEPELIVPASLVAQWATTLARFGVDAPILTHDAIVSAPFVPDTSGRRLVIVDEAHRFRNPATQRYDALARRTIAARCLLVTATPICNGLGDLHALLALILADDALRLHGILSLDRAFEIGDASRVAALTRAAIVRRGRDALPESLRFGDLRREVVRHPIDGGDAKRLIDALRFPLVGETAPLELLRRLLWRRLESSEAALLETIERQRRFYRRALDALAGGRTLTKSDYRRVFGREDEGELVQEVLFWNLWLPEETPHSADAATISEELARLETLRQSVTRTPRVKRDALLALLSASAEPTLLFTGAIATARDLYEACRTLRRCGLVTSHQARDEYGRAARPEQLFAAFRFGRIDLLIATDLAGEGLDLQAASTVIHYDLPWNPARLDQRNGRAHRIGQRHGLVRAVYFIPDRVHDESEIVATLAAKNRTRNRFLQDAEEEPAIDRALAPTRLTLRAYVPRRSPQARLYARLEAGKLAARDITNFLSERHPAGMERLIGEMAGEYLDRARVEDLLRFGVDLGA